MLGQITLGSRKSHLEEDFTLSFFKKIFYCSSSTVDCIYPPPIHPHNSQPHLPPLIPPPFGFVHMSFIVVPGNHSSLFPHYPLPPPIWLLLDCSLFHCLWLYFACSFVLLIMLHLKLSFYGICLSPPGLFHLA